LVVGGVGGAAYAEGVAVSKEEIVETALRGTRSDKMWKVGWEDEVEGRR